MEAYKDMEAEGEIRLWELYKEWRFLFFRFLDQSDALGRSKEEEIDCLVVLLDSLFSFTGVSKKEMIMLLERAKFDRKRMLANGEDLYSIVEGYG